MSGHHSQDPDDYRTLTAPIKAQKLVPVTCPIGWSARDRHGHSQTVRHILRPELPQEAVIADKTRQGGDQLAPPPANAAAKAADISRHTATSVEPESRSPTPMDDPGHTPPASRPGLTHMSQIAEEN